MCGNLQKVTFDMLVDATIPLTLSCFCQLLESVHHLVEFSQKNSVFMFDYLGVVNICQTKLYEIYENLSKCCKSNLFIEMIDLISCQIDTISLVWVPQALDLNETNIGYLNYK